MDLMVLTTTVASRADAERLATLLVERRLAACVQIFAVESFYRWQGDLQREPEWRLDAKTTAERVAAALQALRQAHPYELPEILAAPLAHAHPSYADWVRAETRPASDSAPLSSGSAGSLPP